MKATEVRRILSSASLNDDITRAAYLFGVVPQTIKRWSENGTGGTSAILLRLLDVKKVDIKDVEVMREP